MKRIHTAALVAFLVLVGGAAALTRSPKEQYAEAFDKYLLDSIRSDRYSTSIHVYAGAYDLGWWRYTSTDSGLTYVTLTQDAGNGQERRITVPVRSIKAVTLDPPFAPANSSAHATVYY